MVIHLKVKTISTSSFPMLFHQSLLFPPVGIVRTDGGTGTNSLAPTRKRTKRRMAVTFVLRVGGGEETLSFR